MRFITHTSGTMAFFPKLLQIYLLGIFFSSVSSAQEETEEFQGGLILPEIEEKTLEEIPFSFGGPNILDKVSHRGKLPKPQNQGSGLSCAGWAVGYGLLSFLHKTPADARNAQYVYHWTRLNEMNETDHIIKDRGCKDLNSAFEAIKYNGSCAVPDYSNFADSPKTETVRLAKQYRALKNFSKFSDSNVESIKLALLDDKVLPGGFKLYRTFINQSAFERRIHPITGKTVPVWKKIPNTDPAMKIGHAMLVVGYDEDLQAFEVMNSFGAEWGDGGYIWIDYDFFASNNCCVQLFTYDDSIEGLVEAAGSREALEQGIQAGTIDGFSKLGWQDLQNGKTEINFFLGEAADMDSVTEGMTLTLDPAVGRLRMRATVKTSDGASPVLIGPAVGILEGNNRIKVSSLRRFVHKSGTSAEYWIRGRLLGN